MDFQGLVPVMIPKANDLPVLGSAAGSKLHSITAEGHERASNPATITRPA